MTDQILLLIDHILAPIEHRARELQATLDELAALEDSTCTGTVHWRDKDTSPKLYINHGLDQPCPLHGNPEPGKRLRCYIGTDTDKQIEAFAAMERHRDKINLEHRHDQLEAAIRNAKRHLERFYGALGYSTPTDSEPAKPYAHWRPGTRPL